MRCRADHTRQQRLLRHFEREDRHRLRVLHVGRDMVRDVQRERRFAHRGPRGEDDQLAFVHARRHLIELVETRADALDALAGIEKDVDAAFETGEDLLGVDQRVAGRVSPSFRRVSSAPARISSGSSSPDDAAVDQLLRREDDPPQGRLVLDDPDVAVEREDLRQAVIQRDQVAEAVDGLELVLLHQLIGDGDAVDALAAVGQVAHAQEDAPVLLEAEILRIEEARRPG